MFEGLKKLGSHKKFWIAFIGFVVLILNLLFDGAIPDEFASDVVKLAMVLIGGFAIQDHQQK